MCHRGCRFRAMRCRWFSGRVSLKLRRCRWGFSAWKWCSNRVQMGLGWRFLQLAKRFERAVLKNPRQKLHKNSAGDYFRYTMTPCRVRKSGCRVEWRQPLLERSSVVIDTGARSACRRQSQRPQCPWCQRRPRRGGGTPFPEARCAGPRECAAWRPR